MCLHTLDRSIQPNTNGFCLKWYYLTLSIDDPLQRDKKYVSTFQKNTNKYKWISPQMDTWLYRWGDSRGTLHEGWTHGEAAMPGRCLSWKEKNICWEFLSQFFGIEPAGVVRRCDCWFSTGWLSQSYHVVAWLKISLYYGLFSTTVWNMFMTFCHFCCICICISMWICVFVFYLTLSTLPNTVDCRNLEAVHCERVKTIHWKKIFS